MKHQFWQGFSITGNSAFFNFDSITMSNLCKFKKLKFHPKTLTQEYCIWKYSKKVQDKKIDMVDTCSVLRMNVLVHCTTLTLLLKVNEGIVAKIFIIFLFSIMFYLKFIISIRYLTKLLIIKFKDCRMIIDCITYRICGLESALLIFKFYIIISLIFENLL